MTIGSWLPPPRFFIVETGERPKCFDDDASWLITEALTKMVPKVLPGKILDLVDPTLYRVSPSGLKRSQSGPSGGFQMSVTYSTSAKNR